MDKQTTGILDETQEQARLDRIKAEYQNLGGYGIMDRDVLTRIYKLSPKAARLYAALSLDLLVSLACGEAHRSNIIAILKLLKLGIQCPECGGTTNQTCGALDCHGGTRRDGAVCYRCAGKGSVSCDICEGEGEL